MLTAQPAWNFHAGCAVRYNYSVMNNCAICFDLYKHVRIAQAVKNVPSPAFEAAASQ